jgi:TPR repeat protein
MMDKLWSSLCLTLGVALFVLFTLNYLVRVSDGTGSSTGIVFDYLFGGDLQEEIDTLRALAEQGNARAQYNLGVMYDYGEGVPEDDAEAVLFLVLLVAEPSLVTGMDLACGLREGGHGSLFLSALGEGVATRASDSTQPSRFLAGVSQWNEGDAAEPEVASLALDDRSQHPALGTAGGHKQVEATAVGDPSGAVSRLRGLHGACGEDFLRMS